MSKAKKIGEWFKGHAIKTSRGARPIVLELSVSLIECDGGEWIAKAKRRNGPIVKELTAPTEQEALSQMLSHLESNCWNRSRTQAGSDAFQKQGRLSWQQQQNRGFES